MIDYRRISASFELNLDYFKGMPDEEKKRIIKIELEMSFAHFLTEHFEDIPRKYDIIMDPDTGRENHTVYLNLISNDELKRLRAMEEIFYAKGLYLQEVANADEATD